MKYHEYTLFENINYSYIALLSFKNAIFLQHVSYTFLPVKRMQQ